MTKKYTTSNRFHLKFTPITDHYGYSHETYNGLLQYLLWRHKDGKKYGYPITGRLKRSEAVHECKYLEALNFGGK